MTLTPAETYAKLIKYGGHKAAHSYPALIVQSWAGGLWVGVYGHICTFFAGSLYADHTRSAIFASKLTYGVIFSGALTAIVFTGAELFTGNTMAMMMCCVDKKCTQWDMWRVWLFSLIFNFVGAFTVAGFSHLSGAFPVGSDAADYLCSSVEGKVGHGWGEVMLLAIGCNLLVCLAVWHATYCTDGAGKILGVFQCICAFCVGGFEHIIANFYTLSLGLFHQCVDVSIADVIVWNWLPVLLGNCVAGIGITAMIWWYGYHPRDEFDTATDKQLLVALASKILSDEEAAAVAGADSGTTVPGHGMISAKVEA